MERHSIGMPTPVQQLKPLRRQFSAVSPTRRSMGSTGDDLLFLLTPTCAVDSLLHPTGTLKQCLAHATRAELEFAMRAAVASGRIQDWLDEVMDWPWASVPGPRGFKMPMTSIKTVEQCASVEEVIAKRRGCLIGYLDAEDVLQFERRIEEILTELDELQLEEIKSHVLVEHINPDMRSGATFEIAAVSLSSRFHRLSDIAAVLAAIVLQALPLLSRLTRNLTIWSLRLAILRRIPPFFLTLNDAEIALRTGWSAIDMTSRYFPPETPKTPIAILEMLTRQEFTKMKTAISNKISISGKHLDFMLDQLEGLDDTIPGKWIDRVEVVEKDYSEWVAACERKIRQADFDKIAEEHAHERALKAPAQILPSDSPPVPELRITDTAQKQKGSRLSTISDASIMDPSTENERGLISEFSYLTGDTSLDMGRDNVSSDEESLPAPDSSIRRSSNSSNITETPLRLNSSVVFESSPATSQKRPYLERLDSSFNLESSPVPLRGTRALRAKSAPTRDDIPTTPIMESSQNEPFYRSLDITNNIQNVPSHSTSDDQLQQQISSILSSIPAKITLSASPTKRLIDLNPPDLNLPKLRQKVSRERNLCSMSSFSSRSQTPSFHLAPAERRSRSRASGNKEIKVYHLSRSNGEAPIKLFIRLVGDNGERVMVRVGGGWADLGEYLKEYATHHRRANASIEVRGLNGRNVTPSMPSSPPSRPHSAMEYSPITPIHIRKSRKGSVASECPSVPRLSPAYMAPTISSENAAAITAATLRARDRENNGYSSGSSTRSCSSSRGDSPTQDMSPVASPRRPLGLSGPKSRPVEMTEESKQWVKQVTERVRIASGEFRAENDSLNSAVTGRPRAVSGGSVRGISGGEIDSRFGEMGKVGGTKRLFRRG